MIIKYNLYKRSQRDPLRESMQIQTILKLNVKCHFLFYINVYFFSINVDGVLFLEKNVLL